MMVNDRALDKKRIAKNTLLLYVRMLLTMAVSLYTSRVVLNTLGVEDYGIYNVVGGVIVMLGFLTGSLSGASSRYITFALGKGDLQEQKRTFGNVLSIHALLAVIIILVGETLGLWFVSTQLQIPVDRELAAFWVYQCSILSSVMAIIAVPFNATIIAHEKMSAFAYISVADAVLKLLIVYLLVVFPFDKLIVYAALLLLIQAFDVLVYVVYCYRKFKDVHTGFACTPKLFKEMFAFAGWIMNGNLAVVGYTQGLNMLLNIFFNPSVNAARGIAVQVQSVCQQFCTNFQMAVRPQIIKSYAQGELDYMHGLLVKSSKFSFFILFFIALPLMFEAELILQLWLGIVPEYTVTFLRLVLVSGLLYTLSNPIITSVHATGNLRKFQLVEGTMLLSIVPIAYVLLKYFDVPPAAVFCVHIVVEIFTQLARLKIVLPMIRMDIRIYIRRVLKPVLTVFVLAPVLPFLVYNRMTTGYMSFFVVCAVCVLSNACCMYLLGCTSAEKCFVKDKIESVVGRLNKVLQSYRK